MSRRPVVRTLPRALARALALVPALALPLALALAAALTPLAMVAQGAPRGEMPPVGMAATLASPESAVRAGGPAGAWTRTGPGARGERAPEGRGQTAGTSLDRAALDRAALERAELAWETLAAQAEITRTTRGIPHIRAENTAAAGFALGWVQMEDYGIQVVDLLLGARGETARHYGPGANDARVNADLRAKRTLRMAEEAFPSLPADLQGMYEGFALAVNRWLELFPEDGPPSLAPDFTGAQVLARDVPGPNWAMGERFARRLEEARESQEAAWGTGGGGTAARPWEDGTLVPVVRGADALAEGVGMNGYEPGSNTWALAPERTTSGHAILMRNPHLNWTSGYYEGHMIIEGDLEFYGDFRIGGPFSVIGGWNRHLGWSTTNNGPQLSDLYALRSNPREPDQVWWEGAWTALERHEYRVEVWNGRRVEPRELVIVESPLGPVVHREGESVYVVRTSGDGEPRLGEQFLAMMRADSFEAWRDAMRMQARTQSNFTYADADGNIFYVWNAMHPVRPHPFGGDSVAHPAERASDAWQTILPFDDLPQLLNPPGGYLRNENDPFHHTNLNAVLDPADFPPVGETPQVRLRSQASLEILHGDRVFSLEEVVEEKGTERMLLAERVLDDLLAALRDAQGAARDPASPGRGAGVPAWSEEHDRGLALLEAWDRTVAVEARGAVLFVEWWERYLAGAERAPSNAAAAGFSARAGSLFAEPWTPEAPMTTPRGLAGVERAVEAFLEAVPATRERWGAVEVPWGAVHRARHGTLDLPVSGCDGLLGCFRVLWFNDAPDGRRVVRGGDGWVSAVEFGPEPRAFTVLAYGQSARPESPFHQDQLHDFVEHRMTPVAWTPEAIAEATLVRYRPGEDRHGVGRPGVGPGGEGGAR